MNPLVTVVTPSFNQGHFIRATIESVLAQDYPAIEYIVMDGGSTDETLSVVKDYASRLTFISERDRGQSHAINKGFHRGRGRLLGWINSDDIYLPGAVSAAVRAFEAHPGCGMVYGEGYVIDRQGANCGRFPYSRPFDLWRLTYLSDYVLQQSSYYRREALDNVGHLDEDLDYGLDWDLFIRIGMRYPVVYIPEYMGAIREYEETKSSRGSLERARELHTLLRRHTGMRLPPGSIVYGGETYLRLLRNWIERHTPPGFGLVARAAGWGLPSLIVFAIAHTLQHSQHLYADGWAGDRLQYMLHEGAGSLLVSGCVPAEPVRFGGQRLTIYANGVALGTYAAAGEFELQVPVPRELERTPLRLLVSASRYHRPHLWRGDRRRLAWRMKQIRWA